MKTALVMLAGIGLAVVGIILCCSKVGVDGNWYAEHMAENTPDNDPEK